MLAATALLACTGSASAALTPAQLEAFVKAQTATNTALQRELNSLRGRVKSLEDKNRALTTSLTAVTKSVKPLVGITTKLLQVRRRLVANTACQLVQRGAWPGIFTGELRAGC